MRKAIEKYLKDYCTKVKENEDLSYIDLMMDDHKCIDWDGIQYYVPETTTTMVSDELVFAQDYLLNFKPRVSGTGIKRIHTNYENINIVMSDDSQPHGERIYSITPEQLVVVLSEFDFDVKLKRTKSWLEVDIDDFTIIREDNESSGLNYKDLKTI